MARLYSSLGYGRNKRGDKAQACDYWRKGALAYPDERRLVDTLNTTSAPPRNERLCTIAVRMGLLMTDHGSGCAIESDDAEMLDANAACTRARIGPARARVAERRAWTRRSAPRSRSFPRSPTRAMSSAAAFSRDGAHVLTGSEDGTLKLWDIATTRLVRDLRGAQGRRHRGRALAGRHAVRCRAARTRRSGSGRFATGRLIRTIYAHLDAAAARSAPWRSHPMASVCCRAAEEKARPSCGTRRPDGSCGCSEHAKGSLSTRRSPPAVFSPDGTRVATGGHRRQAREPVEHETGQLIQAFGEPGVDFIYRVRLAFSPDGARVLVGDNASLTVWDARTGTPIHTLGARMASKEDSLPFVAFSPDGALALTSD